MDKKNNQLTQLGVQFTFSFAGETSRGGKVKLFSIFGRLGGE